MHELAITQHLVDAILENVDGARVAAVRMEIGALSGVVPDAVRFCFEVVSAGTVCEGARLDITEIPGWAHCDGCGGEFGLDVPIPLCPCGSAEVRVLTGRQLRINSVEVV